MSDELARILAAPPPSKDAEIVYLQWNDGWDYWEQVVDEAAGQPGVVAFIRLNSGASV